MTLGESIFYFIAGKNGQQSMYPKISKFYKVALWS